MFSAFKTARQLHEMLWYLIEAQARSLDPDAADRTGQLRNAIEQGISGEIKELQALEVNVLHSRVRATLMEISEEVRASYFATGADHLDPALEPGADLMGKNLSSRRLCGADLRGAYVIGSDLRGSDLSGVDLLGADLRDARLQGADLSRALYVTQPQLNSAVGNSATLLPPDVAVPARWHQK